MSNLPLASTGGGSGGGGWGWTDPQASREYAIAARSSGTAFNDTGYLYVNGSNACSGGPRMFSLANPKAPAFAGCVGADGYTHDSQAVTYHDPDACYTGKEIVLAAARRRVAHADAE
ncbi:hypothetical protein AB0M43_21345 [Longispora sp. NPDC051575]|uniref:hypothetical protein n=1 Tax=Longispora sp. NPDC051575 TaxID=3154943 RepID=UPI00342DDE67